MPIFRALIPLCIAALFAACGGDDDSSAPPPVSVPPPPPPPGTSIGASGGTVTGPTGTSVVIAAGALTTETRILIEQSSVGAPPLPAGFSSQGLMFAFTPHGITFAAPVTITLPFDPAMVPAGATPQFYKTNAQNQWEHVANATFGVSTVTAQVSSFSHATVVIPPLVRNDPVREWDFLIFPGDGSAPTSLPPPNAGGTQVGGDVEDMASFGYTHFDEPVVGFEDTVLSDNEANGFVFSTADGVTYGVFSEAPFSPIGGAAPIGSRTQLKQTQSFIKRAANASLSFTITRVFIDVLDFQPPPADRGARLIQGEVLLSVGAYKTPDKHFFYTAGKAYILGYNGHWVPFARDESFSWTHLWDLAEDFDFAPNTETYEVGNPAAPSSCYGTGATLTLKIPLTLNIDLSSVAVGEEFTLRTDTHAETINRRGGPPGYVSDCWASYVSAYLKDPSGIGGTTFTMTGLEATNRPLPPPPAEVLLPPEPCLPAPGANANAGVIQFDAATYSVDEFAGAESTITVTRTGGSTGAVTATFTTSDGTSTPTGSSGPAIAGVDYTAVNATVFFGDGDASPRTVTVPTIQNLVRAPDKTLNLTLSQPGGCAALGDQTNAVLTIMDDGGAGLPPPPSGLDPGFGIAGKATSPAFGGDRSAMALQADGKIVMVGGRFTDFIFARFNADGSLDAGFGTGGKVITDMVTNEIEEALGVAVQSDGKIVVAGYSDARLALARYNSDGSLDSSFGVGGKVVNGLVGLGNAVAVQPDGKIVVAGETAGDFLLARYNSNGSLDTGFGTAGSLTTDIGGTANRATNIVLESNGNIVVSGGVPKVINGDPATPEGHTDVVRYSANGGLDGSFGTGGKLALPATLVGEGLALAPDGKLLLAGSVNVGSGATASTDFALLRLNSNGSPDTTFGSAGTVVTAISNQRDAALALALQADGKIVLAGSTGNSNTDFAVVRYNSNGTLDASFGGGFGVLTVDFFGFTDSAESVLVLPDGRILLGGVVEENSDGYGLARLNP
jgi:uncharacterized delta-60 repeat protein